MAEGAAMVLLWSSILNWLTPTVLFLLLNLVIAVIFILSSSNTASSTTNQIVRSPSLVLDRLKSFNFHSYNVQTPITQTQSSFIDIAHPQQQPQLEGRGGEEEEEVEEEEHHIVRSLSDTKPAAGEVPEKLPKKMKKSATMKSPFNHFDFPEEEEEKVEMMKRPATMRGREREADGEVDAKADDFINRFKHQLKLQRLDSIIRYKEMLNTGRARN